MSKAERRKRARQRARERERAEAASAAPASDPAVTSAGGSDGVGQGVASLEVATHFAEPEPAVHQAAAPTESEFITGPVVPRVPGPVRGARVIPTGASVPLALAALGGAPAAPAAPIASAVAAPENGADDEDEDADDDQGDDEDEDEDGEEDDEEALDEQDALFNLACASVEQGDRLSWNECVLWLLAADVDDPRLALLSQLLVTEEDSSVTAPLTGQRVLAALQQIGLEDVVTEARETVAAAEPGEEDTEEERAVMRATARELNAQAQRQLEGHSVLPRVEKASKAGKEKPRKASELRAAAAGRTAR